MSDGNQIVSMGGASRRKQLKAQTSWDNDDYCTPFVIKKWLMSLWRHRFGLDPCGSEDSVLEPRVEFLLDHQEDGLKLDWVEAIQACPGAPMTVFVNPPYSRVMPWLRLASWLAAKHPDIQIVFLVPPAIASQFWMRWVWGLPDPTMKPSMAAIPSRPACLVHAWGQPRLSFMRNGEVETQPRGDSALVFYAGERAEPNLMAAYLRNQPQGFILRASRRLS